MLLLVDIVNNILKDMSNLRATGLYLSVSSFQTRTGFTLAGMLTGYAVYGLMVFNQTSHFLFENEDCRIK